MSKHLAVLLTGIAAAALCAALPVSAALPGYDSTGRLTLISEPGESSDPVIFCRGDQDLTMDQVTWAEGRHGQAVQLNGTDEYFRMDYQPVQLTAFTFSAWINWQDDAVRQGLLVIRGSSRGTQRLEVSPRLTATMADGAVDGVCAEMQFGNSDWVLAHPSAPGISTALPTGTWHHIAVTGDADSLELYVDGTLWAQAETMMSLVQLQPKQLVLGRSVNGIYLHALLDDVYLYDQSLSAEQIALLATDEDPLDSAAIAPTQKSLYIPTTTAAAAPTTHVSDAQSSSVDIPWPAVIAMAVAIAVIAVLCIVVNRHPKGDGHR